MPYTEAVDVRIPEEMPEDSIKLYVSPDAVRGRDDEDHPEGGWDWIADGYMVLKTAPARHDGHPATLITLADSDGNREVGRLVLRNDALRDARLVVTRQFEDDEQRYVFTQILEQGPGTDEVKSIQLDITDEGWTEEELGGNSENFPLNVLMAMTKGTTISYRIVQLRGPGGGWPVIEFTGKDRELRKMLVDHYDAGAGGESVAFYMGDDD